jgi:hypothetical protein
MRNHGMQIAGAAVLKDSFWKDVTMQTLISLSARFLWNPALFYVILS